MFILHSSEFVSEGLFNLTNKFFYDEILKRREFDVSIKANTDGLLEIIDMLVELGWIVQPEADTLDGCSWANIDKVAATGKAPNFWAVGDCKKITLNGTVGTLALDNYDTYVYIIDFDHDGTPNTIDFGTFKTSASGGKDVCLIDSKYRSGSSDDGTKYFNMNHWGNYNYGGWAGCDLRYDILGSTNVAPSGYGSAPVSGRTGYDATETTATSPVSGTLMAALPTDLRAVMKPMTIYTDNVGGGTDTASNVTASIDYLPLLAEYEIWGTRQYVNSIEQNYQAQYTYFANGNSKVKYRHSATGSTADWWGRSPYVLYDTLTNFCCVNVWADESSSTYSWSSQGIAPIFRVGAEPAA